jgi:hypothetical protein
MISSVRAALTVALAIGVTRPAFAQETKSIVSDLMVKGKGAFNDFKYKQADSLGRKVLSYAFLLTPQQKLEAMQLIVAAAYPEEEAEQKADVAIEFIQQLVKEAPKATSIPRELSWPGLDSLYAQVHRKASGSVAAAGSGPSLVAPAASSAPAQVRLGSPTPEAFLYVNDKVVQQISTAQYWTIPGGENVKLTIKSVKCTIPWDTTVNVPAGSQVTIGRRLAKECQP